MNKLFVLLLLAAAAGGVYWWKYQRPVEKRVCARLTELCGDDRDDKDDRKSCEKDFADMARNSSPETMHKLDQCLASANSCVEGGGCVVGTGFNAMGDIVKQFGRGVAKALER